ncbi:hypothetical protein BDD12DRAFT_836938 [Trichophaea hybrida]|nr:hypothetical protein BDD12DRAFT_836938 [Trichophaea hybrida]
MHTAIILTRLLSFYLLPKGVHRSLVVSLLDTGNSEGRVVWRDRWAEIKRSSATNPNPL